MKKRVFKVWARKTIFEAGFNSRHYTHDERLHFNSNLYKYQDEAVRVYIDPKEIVQVRITVERIERKGK